MNGLPRRRPRNCGNSSSSSSLSSRCVQNTNFFALDVGDARLPEEVQEVDALDRDVAEAAELVGVPADAVGGGAGLELLPHRVRPGALEGVLFEDAGDDGGERLGLGAVVWLTGEDDGFG